MTTRPASASPWYNAGGSGLREAKDERRKHEHDAEPTENSDEYVSRLAPPPFAVHRLQREEQPEGDETQVEDDVLRVDDALAEVIEVLGDRQILTGFDRSSVPTLSANQLMIQKSRKTTNVAAPATIWFFVVLEMNSPIAMKQPPSSSRPR